MLTVKRSSSADIIIRCSNDFLEFNCRFLPDNLVFEVLAPVTGLETSH